MIQAYLLALALTAVPTDLDRVVVVRNDDSAISRSVTDYYCARRGVRNRVEVHCADSAANADNETMSFADYRDKIETPLRAFLRTHPAIDFIVLTKGIPIRIADAPGRGLGNKRPSLDSYLAALDYDKRGGVVNVPISDSGFTGTAWANRFWRSQARFSHAKFGGYLVTRLDGYTEDDAKALVTRAADADAAAKREKPDGTILLDTCKPFGYAEKAVQPVELFTGAYVSGQPLPPLADIAYKHYNADMQRAADLLRDRQFDVYLDEDDEFVGNRRGLMGYCSWGSNDRFFKPDSYHTLRFAPGGIGETAVSTSARTFLPTAGGQSLVADLVSQGITGVKGYTDEPLLTAVASPSILFDRYTRGWTLAESFYAASRFIGWEDIVLGDPLCRPYAAPKPVSNKQTKRSHR
jgi:uncharacterized protein (TIGR03790 family)